MNKKGASQAILGSKKAVEEQATNTPILEKREERTKYQQVAAGECPHDGSSLSVPVKTKGVGLKFVCSQCQHVWYLNRKIKTCGCLTCKGTRRRSKELAVANRGGYQINIKHGGPLWTRTTDPSLIRKGESTSNYYTKADLNIYIDQWSRELRLKNTAEMTIGNYLGKMKSLLKQYSRPSIQDIKDYLFIFIKQQAGYLSGTIANYIKAFRSFFGYLLNQGLYDIDCRCIPLPKIKYRERCVPNDNDIKKLFRVIRNNEDKLILSLLIDCGIRVTELASIKLMNIDINNSSILINGKGGKERSVYLSESTCVILHNYITGIKRDYLFPVTRDDAQIAHHSRRYFEARLSTMCKEAKIEHITPHQLRHYFATHTLSKGADVKAVSKMLGHADVGITLKIYHHVNAEAVKQMHREYSPLNSLPSERIFYLA